MVRNVLCFPAAASKYKFIDMLNHCILLALKITKMQTEI